MLTALLVAAAVVAGVTGAWSPCGFSMVETLAPGGYAERLRATLLGCLTFTLGALAGGVITFGGLAVLGAAFGAGSTAVAALVALAAAAGEARGARIVPQVRRQVPESWRRRLPVALAAGLYGVLLGLGFTTFILTFAVWALAGVSLALGEVATGVAIGLGFAAGRALPVVVFAPAARTDRGAALHAAMAERPGILRGLRAIDALALAACGVAIAATPAVAQTASPFATGTDPSAGGGAVAWHRPGATGALLRPGAPAPIDLPGAYPVIAGAEIAWRAGDAIQIADLATLAPRATELAPGDAFAISGRWLVWREGRRLYARERGAGGRRLLAKVQPPSQLGRPVLDGDRVVFHRATARGARIELRDLATGQAQVLRSARRALLLQPSLRGDRLLYVRSTAERQQLRLGTLAGGDRTIHDSAPTARRDAGHEPGLSLHSHYEWRDGRLRPVPAPRLPARPAPGVTATLWTTALDDAAAYVTRVLTRGGRTTATIRAVAL